jgi:hypothetical protein
MFVEKNERLQALGILVREPEVGSVRDVKIMGYDALNSIQLGYCYRSVIPSN